ncbi:hypothetical protein LINPERPRIM_LOCUS4754 [Linum perenne]
MLEDWCRVLMAQMYLEGEAQRWLQKFKKEADNEITWEELKVGMRARFKIDFPRFIEDEDPTTWIYLADQYFQFYNTGETDKVFIASIFLEGDAQLWLRAMKESGQEISWEQLKEWLYDIYSSMKSSEVSNNENFTLEKLPVQEEEVIKECKELDEFFVDISTKNSSVIFFSTIESYFVERQYINTHVSATARFQMKDENIEDGTTSLMSLVMEDSIINLSCVFIFLLVNWIDPDGNHFKLFDNG